mmetsp:Transcript_120766/g.376043  ORF Transcript_120766/g.376043 Transcript_120766/m.376043 type:complete len:578 (-) Transcript_120766:208-1941(-)
MGETGGLSFSGATAGYEEDPQAKLCNQTCVEVFRGIHASQPHSNNYIFEIGSGTGGTTSFVLPTFNPHTTRYVFSDLSQAFLTNARGRFAQKFPFVEFTIFNGDKHPADQGFHSHEMHQILATNVIHATIHLASTMSTCHTLLGPGGHIIFNEVQNGGTLGEDLTFGLTDGWWMLTDCERRVTYPLMLTPEWQNLFTACNFRPVWSTSDQGAIFSQQAIHVAREAPRESRLVTKTYHGIHGNGCMDPKASYLITGAVGGLGLVSALIMIETGAQNLHFVSRRDRVPTEAMQFYSRVAASTASIKRERCNVSSATEVGRCLVDYPKAPPHFGFIQAAGVLSDGTIMRQTRQKYVEVFGPKHFGAWHLHRFSSHKAYEMQMGIMFASGAGFFGSAGQNNHSSANAGIDACADMRNMVGLAAGSVSWGAVSVIGYAARHDIAKGDGAVSYDHAWAVLEVLQATPCSIVGIVPGAWASGMGALPMKAMIYAGCAGRFRMIGPRKTPARPPSQAAQQALAGDDEADAGPAVAEAVEEPPEDDPASVEYRNVFAVMQEIHNGWKGPMEAELGSDLGLGAQEVC